MKKMLIPVLLIIAVLISGCTSTPDQSPVETQPLHTAPAPEETTVALPMTATVENLDFAFYPPVVVIARGGTVTWKQKDSTSHTVTGDGFDSGKLLQNQIFSHTFNEVGTYEYTSTLDASMKGKIIVK